MIDLTQLTTFLAPFLGFLVSASKGAIQEGLNQFGRQAPDHAKALWDRLWPKLSRKAAAVEAAEDVAARPDDARARAALELQLEKILSEDARLLEEMTELWKKAAESGEVAVKGDRNVVTGGDMHSSVIVTGDHTAIRH